ncbi:MAG: DUF2391 family protein [Candidatus Nanoarchaeia archaeon]
MRSKVICKIEREIEDEKKELELLESHVERIRETLLEKVPQKFSKRDVINAFFGSLILGLTFVLKGGIIETSLNLTPIHLTIIVIATLLILMSEIYLISYSRVKDRTARRAGQFIAKRLLTLYTITIITTVFLVYLLNLNNNPLVENSFGNVVRLVVINSFPCAIGAAVPSLLKKY